MPKSQLKEKALKLSPGGVQSPVRYIPSEDDLLFFDKASGATLYDPEGHAWVDYVGGYGPMILGHAHPEVVSAMQTQSATCLSMGACHRLEAQLAACIQTAMPHLDMIRFVNSGTEAAMTAVRLARAVTKRNNIIKFDGGYHGHVDALLVEAGSGALTLNQPSSPGIPEGTTQHTQTLPYNDLDAVQRHLKKDGEHVAAIIVEPIAGNMGMIKPVAGFLSGLRALCDTYGILLIIDEVMTGFRVAWGGAQALYQVQGDLTLLGKIIGGGLPVGAIGGREAIMKQLAPTGPVYQAGTLSGNPLTMAAGLATLTTLSTTQPYKALEAHAVTLGQGLTQRAEAANIPISWDQAGGMMGLFFSEKLPKNREDVLKTNRHHFNAFLKTCLQNHLFWPPSAFESAFISTAHNEHTRNKTYTVWEKALAQMQKNNMQ